MALFHHLAQLADQLATEPGRLKKRAAIAAAIRSIALPLLPADNQAEGVSPSAQENAGLFAQYLAGQPFPEADPRKLNAGGALLTRALLTVSHATEAQLSTAYRQHGDLGAAAFDLLKTPVEPTITLDEIAAAFNDLATARTTASRSATVIQLLQRATPLDAKYLLKLMLGDMRIGVKQSLIEEAIAIASDNEVAAVRHAVMLEADLAHAVTLAFTHTLADARMRLFHPLGFMLASPVETPEEAIARFTSPSKNLSSRPKRTAVERPAGQAATNPEDNPAESVSPSAQEAYLEDKFDGMRAQIHAGDPTQPNRVAIYSRNREDITESFPELAEAFANIPTPLILDGEILGWDLATNKALPFAILGQRIGRKRVDDTIRQQIPVIFMAFDILFQAGELLLNHPLRTRRQRLETLTANLAATTASPLKAPDSTLQHSLFSPQSDDPQIPRLYLSPATLVTTPEAIDQAYADARARANEGVMLKAAASHYQPGRRGLAWVKLKRTLETLDVVITGAEYGHGRRAGLLSDYTFAVQAPSKNGSPPDLLNVGKAYSGVTDAEILELTAWLKAHTLEDHGHFRTVEPIRIFEVAFNNIMRSTRHASGFALRFPRILRIRDDKPLTEIDTLARVEQIYQSQPDKPTEE